MPRRWADIVPKLCVAAITVFVTLLSADGCTTVTSASMSNEGRAISVFSIAIYALSRGRGVPDKTRQVFQKARHILEEAKQQGKVLQLVETRIGLEGEIKLCAEFIDGDTANDILEKIRQLAMNVELLNVRQEPCTHN